MSRSSLHVPGEIAGQVALTARALRSAGLKSTSYAPEHPFGYHAGPDASPAGGRLRNASQLARLVATHEVVHFHFARSFLPEAWRFADARLLRLLKRGRVLMTVWGSDARQPSLERGRNPHFVPFLGEDDERARRRLRRWSQITGGHVVNPDPALHDHVAPFFAHVHRSRAIVDVARYRAAPPDPDVRRPRIVHSPTERAGKGTAYVRAAVAALRARGLVFDYDEVREVPQKRALERYCAADLVVDQLCSGAHGVFALEAMSMAKPVLCHVAPHRERYPAALPLIQADPDTVTDVLADWLERPLDRRACGLAGRAYVEREHDVAVVGAGLARIYEERFG